MKPSEGLTPDQRAWHENPESKEYYAILSMFIEMWWVWWKADPSNVQHLRPEQWQDRTATSGQYYPLYYVHTILLNRLKTNATQFADFIHDIAENNLEQKQMVFSIDFQQFVKQSLSLLVELAAHSRSESIRDSKQVLETTLRSGLSTAFHVMNESMGAVFPDHFVAFHKLVSGVDLEFLPKAIHGLEQKSAQRYPVIPHMYVFDIKVFQSWGLGVALQCPAGIPVSHVFFGKMYEWKSLLGVSLPERQLPLREIVQWYFNHIVQDIVPWYQKLDEVHKGLVGRHQRKKIENWIEFAKQSEAKQLKDKQHDALS